MDASSTKKHSGKLKQARSGPDFRIVGNPETVQKTGLAELWVGDSIAILLISTPELEVTEMMDADPVPMASF